MKLSVDAANVTDGFRVLEYLFESGPGSIDEISDSIALPREQVISQLQIFMNHGFVEETE